MKKLLEHLMYILNEGSMSDDDKRDSDILKNIMAKRGNRANAKLTPLEISTLKKYGLDPEDTYGGNINGKGIYVPYNNTTAKDEYNLADKLRKEVGDEREYAKMVNRTGYQWGPEKEYSVGDDSMNYNYRKTFQDRERIADNENSDYRSDLRNFKSSKHDVDYHQKNLDSMDDKRAKIQQEYERKLKDLDWEINYHKGSRDSAQDNLDSIKKKYSRNKSEALDEDLGNYFQELYNSDYNWNKHNCDYTKFDAELKTYLKPGETLDAKDENGYILDSNIKLVDLFRRMPLGKQADFILRFDRMNESCSKKSLKEYYEDSSIKNKVADIEIEIDKMFDSIDPDSADWDEAYFDLVSFLDDKRYVYINGEEE